MAVYFDRIKRQAKANRFLKKAVDGGLIARPCTCDLCGSTPHKYSYGGKYRVAIVGHHYLGYSPEHYLDVWWLCHSCNTRLAHTHNGDLTKEEAREFIVNKRGRYNKITHKDLVYGVDS